MPAPEAASRSADPGAWEEPARRRSRLPPAALVVLALVLVALAAVASGTVTTAPIGVSNEGEEQAGEGIAFGQLDPMAEAPISGRVAAESVWTGEEWLIWGGATGGDSGRDHAALADGAAYDPATDSWRVLPPAPLEPRYGVTAVWAGDRLVVWGGLSREGDLSADGAAYLVAEDRWEPLPPGPLEPRASATGFAWGSEVFIVGGAQLGFGEPTPPERLRDGAALDLGTGRWRSLRPLPEEVGVVPWTSAVAGDQFVTWDAGRGWRYSPERDLWAPLPAPPDGATGTQTSMLAPLDAERVLVLGLRPIDELWAAGTVLHLHDGWGPAVGIQGSTRGPTWVRSAGGEDGAVALLPDGWPSHARQSSPPALFDANLDRWLALPGEIVADRANYMTAWTGEELLVWGGSNFDGLRENETHVRADGYRWRLTDS